MNQWPADKHLWVPPSNGGETYCCRCLNPRSEAPPDCAGSTHDPVEMPARRAKPEPRTVTRGVLTATEDCDAELAYADRPQRDLFGDVPAKKRRKRKV